MSIPRRTARQLRRPRRGAGAPRSARGTDDVGARRADGAGDQQPERHPRPELSDPQLVANVVGHGIECASHVRGLIRDQLTELRLDAPGLFSNFPVEIFNHPLEAIEPALDGGGGTSPDAQPEGRGRGSGRRGMEWDFNRTREAEDTNPQTADPPTEPDDLSPQEPPGVGAPDSCDQSERLKGQREDREDDDACLTARPPVEHTASSSQPRSAPH
jgi:hypothetical protein